MTIRSILSALVVFLGSAALLAVSLHVRTARHEVLTTERFALSDAVRAKFMRAAADLARERGRTYLALRQPAPDSPEDAQRLSELRRRTDRSLEDALSALNAAGFASLLSGNALADVAADTAAFRDARAEADEALAQPQPTRSPAAGERWFTSVSTLVESTQGLRIDLLRALPTADKLLTDLSSLKHFAWITSEQAAQAHTLLAGAVAEQRAPKDQEFATIAASDAKLALAWGMVRDLVRIGAASELTRAVSAAERVYFDELMRLREQIFSAARSGSPYPISAEQWLTRAVEAINALIGVQVEAVRETEAHTAALTVRAHRHYAAWLAFGMLGLAAVVLCLAVLEQRVLRPLRTLTASTARLAEGDLRAPVPRGRRPDELGAMVRALRRLKANALAGQRLRASREQAERRATEEILDREARLRAIFDSVTEGILTINAESGGRVEAANVAAGALFGCPSGALVGRTVASLVPELERLRYEGAVQDYLATGRSDLLGTPQELTALRADSSPMPVEVTIAEARSAKGRFLAASLRDITERRRVERIKSEFVSTVSHELRTPLTSIRGSLGLLLGPFAGQLTGQVRPLVEMAHRNADRLIGLVNDILDIERIEGGRLEFSFRPLDLVTLVREAVDTNQSFAAERGVTLRFVSAPPALEALGDPARLLQVMANLLSNAAKFSERGSEVAVAIERDDGSARVCVRDRGPGVPDDFRGRIFQRFAQADSADTRRLGGTGLGLSISKAIVERHGGRIGFDSRPGDTVFYFTLPVLAPRPAPSAEADASADRGCRILICEDDPDAAQILRLMVVEKGFAADVAHTVAELREMLERRRYAALTLDLSLPDGSGLDLVRELWADERHRDLPIIVISARAADARCIVNGDAVGVIGWLTKPVEARLLGSALDRAMVGRDDRQPCILCVKDDPDMVALVERLLEGRASLVHAPSVAEARAQIGKRGFDVVMLDLTLPDGSGLELLPRLRELPSPPTIMIFAAGTVGEDFGARLQDALATSRTTNEELVDRILDLVGMTQ